MASFRKRTLGLSSKAHRVRYREVIKVLAKYGLDEFLVSDRGKKLPLVNRYSHNEENIRNLPRPVRLRLAIEELNGAYVKAAQILSNRPDILSKEYIEELEKLQDSVPPFPGEEAIDLIESQLGEKLHNLFLMFDDTPLASGSIAQVHRAVMFDGTPVVVKVRRPGILEKFQIDIDILRYISKQTARFSKFKSQFKDSNPIDELSKEIFKELFFDLELKNMKDFERKMRDIEGLYVPRSFRSFSNEEILTMEYIEGIKVTDINSYHLFDHDPEIIANKLVDIGLTQIFDYRFFHGDPHPGNILIMEDGRICFLDLGLMGRISKRQRENIIDLVSSYSRNDYKKLTRIVMKYAPKEMYVDEDKLEGEVADLLDKYYEVELNEINVGEALVEVMNFILKYKITLNFNSYLLIKALSSYEGIGKRIYPKFELTPHAKKFTEKIVKEQFSPKRIARDFYLSGSDLVTLIRDFPSEISELINMIQGGRLRLNIGILGLNDTVDYVFEKVNKVVNRLIVAIMLSAVILGSSLILKTTEGQGVTLLHYIAYGGFMLSIFISLILVISIIRNKGI